MIHPPINSRKIEALILTLQEAMDVLYNKTITIKGSKIYQTPTINYHIFLVYHIQF